jgi:hypothetical protein
MNELAGNYTADSVVKMEEASNRRWSLGQATRLRDSETREVVTADQPIHSVSGGRRPTIFNANRTTLETCST